MNYKDKNWITKRKAILKRDKYQCQECRRYGRLIDASHVHHIWPVEFYPEYKLCSWNLISLCDKCHNKMHERKTHELTAEGERLKLLHIPPKKVNQQEIPPVNKPKRTFLGNGGGNHFQL